MKRFLFCCSLFAFFVSQAQQINPVPDYVFRNQMSVGRNAVTDTAAYFSVGPRFGATKGMMPPMVVDTATFSYSKRNGLLIFSVQKNKYLYWDSVRVQWSDMAGSSGQYITGTVTSGKIPKATSSTVITDSRMSESGLLISAPRFKADSMFFLPKMSTTPTDTGAVRYSLTDSTAYLWTGYQWIKTGISKQDTASMLTSYLRKVDTATMLSPYLRKIDTLTMLSPYVRAAGYGLTKSGQSLLVDTAAMATRARVQKAVDSLGGVISTGITGTGTTNYIPKFTSQSAIGNSIISEGFNVINVNGDITVPVYYAVKFGGSSATAYMGDFNANGNINFATGSSTKMLLNSSGELLVNTTSDAGAYALQVAGSIYNTTGADIGASSGSLRIGTTVTNQVYGTTPILQVAGDAGFGIFQRFQNNSFGSVIGFTKSRNSTKGSHTILQDADQLGRLGFFGSDGSAFIPGATIESSIDGTPSSNVMPARLQFFTTPAASGTPSERMRITSGGNVGIGTISPVYKLAINTSTAAGTYGNSIEWQKYNNASAFVGISYDDTNDGLSFNASVGVVGFNRQYMFINRNTGNVGIGTTNPVTNLDIKASISGAYTTSSSQAPLRIYNVTNAGGINSSVITFQSSTDNESSNPVARIGVVGESAGTNLGAMIMMTRDASGVIERMRITSAGELLVNTTSDAGDYKLQVNGNVYVGGHTTAFGGGYSPNAYIYSDPDIMRIVSSSSSSTNKDIQFWTKSDVSGQRMVITAGGNVGISTTSPGAKVHSSTSANSINLFLSAPLYDAGGASYSYYTELKLGNDYSGLTSIGQSAIRSYANVWSNSGSIMTFATSTDGGTLTERLRISSSGELLVNTTSDAGAYVLQASGAIYNTGSAAFAVTSGSVSIGTTSAQTALTVQTAGESKANFQGGSGSQTGINFGDAGNNQIGKLIYDNNGDYMAFHVNASERLRINSTGAAEFSSTIKTAAPSGGTAATWKLGTAIGQSVTLDTGSYIEVEINGTFYRLAIVNPS